MNTSFFQEQDCTKLKVLQNSSSSLKASVYIQQCGLENKSVIVKDFSHAPFFLRKTLCRLLLSREVKALKRLRSVAGVPRFLGYYSSDGFVMELIEGQHPNKQQFRESGVLQEQFKVLLRSIHDAGVTHNDVRMKNIIIADNNQIFIIDYAASFVVGDKTDLLYCLKLPVHCLLRLIDDSKVVDFSVDNNNYTANSNDRKVFRFIRKFHVVVDGWKFLLKIIRKNK